MDGSPPGSSIHRISSNFFDSSIFFFLMHAGRTTVTIQSYKIVSKEVKDNQVLLGASQLVLVVKNPFANTVCQ